MFGEIIALLHRFEEADNCHQKITDSGNSPDRFRADVEGDIENVNGLLKITNIRVRYTLKTLPKEEADARWAFENYIEHCPAAQSVIGCIQIDHNLELIPE